MAVLGCAALAIAAYGTAVYAYTRPEIPKVSVALIVSSCLVGAVSGLLGLRLGTFLEQVRR
jgi:ABC-type branched-subunit amino acid transport system permease subunit